MTAYQLWVAGRCPCCQGDVDEYIDGTPPEVIAEGVMICGRCSAMDHMSPPEFRAALLESIARRDDGPIERLLA